MVTPAWKATIVWTSGSQALTSLMNYCWLGRDMYEMSRMSPGTGMPFSTRAKGESNWLNTPIKNLFFIQTSVCPDSSHSVSAFLSSIHVLQVVARLSRALSLPFTYTTLFIHGYRLEWFYTILLDWPTSWYLRLSLNLSWLILSVTPTLNVSDLYWSNYTLVIL